MWKRIIRNEYGGIESAYDDTGFIYYPVYDDIKPNGMSGNKTLSVKYTVYAQTDEQAKHQGENWWEDYYDSYETDSMRLAAKEFILKLLNNKYGDVKFFMEIDGVDGTHAEQWMDIPWDVIRPAREILCDGINKQIDSLNKRNEDLTIAVDTYKRFLEDVHGQEMFRKWCSENKIYGMEE